jgi:NhaP-type Na+/H+ or K+/H+ antiporter
MLRRIHSYILLVLHAHEGKGLSLHLFPSPLYQHHFQLHLNEVVLGTAFGIIIGPHGGNIIDPRSWSSSSESQNNITLEFMRIVLGTGLFIIGVELPGNYMRTHARSLLAMVIPTMAAGWLLIGGILKLLFPSLTYVSCLTIAACLTPTDPIICAAIAVNSQRNTSPLSSAES